MSSHQQTIAAGRNVFRLRLLRKVVQYVLVIAIALTINFALPRIAPGDPLSFVIGEQLAQGLSPAERQEIMTELGMGGSIFEQYVDFMKGIFTLDLGSSTKFAQPVTEVIWERLPWTFLVVLPTLILAPLIGVSFGAYAAWNRGEKRDVGLLAGTLMLESMPGFWVGMILIAIFAVNLGWFPTFGAAPMIKTDSFSYLMGIAHRMILPVTTITLSMIGSYFLLTRSSMLDTLGQDYMMMAEAKGVSRKTLIYKHALRNALLPVYTHMTMSLGLLFGGAVIVESVFAYPGIGRLLYDSVLARDFPLMQGVFLFVTLGIILANLLADITYPLVDPRARIRKPREGSV